MTVNHKKPKKKQIKKKKKIQKKFWIQIFLITFQFLKTLW